MKTRTLLLMVLIVFLVLPLITAEKNGKNIPDYSTTLRKDVPVEFTWKMEDLYPDLGAWEKDKNELLQLFARVDETAKGWTSSPRKMLALLELRNDLLLKGTRLRAYASNQGNMDLSNSTFQQMNGQVRNMLVQFQSKFSFMKDDILKLGKEKFESYLKAEPGLKPYTFDIEDIFRTEAHVLPADQQALASLTGLFSRTSGRAAGILNDVDMPSPELTLSDGTKITLNYANYSKYRAGKNREDRELVMRTFWENHKKFENTFAVLFDGGMKQHLFNARIHKYNDCLEAALSGDAIDPAVYHNLIKYVRENLGPLHRYLELKKELLGLDKFRYSDMYASAVKSVEKEYTYEEAQEIILKAMQPLGKEYTGVLKQAFENRWIDVYPNKGKQSGAYSGGVYGVHPFIKMNYDGSYDNVSTLAHELGHAVHSYFTDKTQHFANADYPTFLAEIASTFNENLLLQYLLKYEKDDLLKLFLLDGFVQQIKGTIYRQVHFAEFELAMHREVENGGTLTPQWLNDKYLKLARYYYGHDKGVVDVDEYIQNEWASIPHFFMNYYVYTYSTGMIASMALSDMVLNGKKAEQEKYLNFLKAGGSRYPLDTLREAGVDMTTPAPYEAAFKRIGEIVTEMEKIVKRLKKK
jgi:oligoendopeptidase F